MNTSHPRGDFRDLARQSARAFLPSVLLVTAALAAHADPDVIAQVSGQDVKVEDIRPYLDNLGEQERAALDSNPALLNQTVRLFLLQKALLKEAQAAGWDKRPEVTDQLERVRQSAIAESYLKEVAKVPDDYPTEADIRSAYDAKKKDLVLPRQYQLAEIFVSVSKDADKAENKRAQNRIRAIALKLEKEDFAKVAERESEERQSATRGGEIGWLAEASIRPEIREKIDPLGKDGKTAPLQLDDGWYIVKVMDVSESRTATFDEVKDRLTEVLRTERAKLNREAYFAKLQKQTPVAINELALAKLLERDKK